MNYIGYFGKLPEKGDFIHQGIGMDEKEVWDAWLQDGIVIAREALAGSWAASYAHRSVWRFLASTPGAQRSGVLLFSHDRVGREFPFVALFGDDTYPSRVPNLAVGDIDASLAFAERLVAAAYDGLVPVEQLATLLQNLPWRSSVAETLRESDGALSSYTAGAPGQPLQLDVVLLQAFIRDDAHAEPRSLWWRCPENGGLERAVLNRGPLTSHLFGELLAATEGAALVVSESGVEAQSAAEAQAPEGATPQNVSRVETGRADDDPVDFNSLLG